MAENIEKFIKIFVVIFLLFFIFIDLPKIRDSIKIVVKNYQNFSLKENSIVIPEIGVSAPLILSASLNKKEIEKLLKKGAVHFPNSVLPGKNGQTIILGHSSPADWPKINYDWIFNQLEQLKENDEIFVYFNHRKYTYYVENKTFLNKGEEIPFNNLTNSENILILLTCWPLGQDYQRIAIKAI